MFFFIIGIVAVLGCLINPYSKEGKILKYLAILSFILFFISTGYYRSLV